MDNNSAFEINRGDDVTISVTVLDDEGDPKDLDGYVIFFTAKTSLVKPDEEAVLSFECSCGDGDGIVDIVFTAEDTNLLKIRSYWWDIQLEKDGVITSTRRQLFRVVGDVTRRVLDGY